MTLFVSTLLTGNVSDRVLLFWDSQWSFGDLGHDAKCNCLLSDALAVGFIPGKPISDCHNISQSWLADDGRIPRKRLPALLPALSGALWFGGWRSGGCRRGGGLSGRMRSWGKAVREICEDWPHGMTLLLPVKTPVMTRRPSVWQNPKKENNFQQTRKIISNKRGHNTFS